jgi:putative Holliday junction resolvase
VRYLGIDLGEKRTGLALGDAESGIVSPLKVLEIGAAADGGRALLEGVAKAALEHRPDAIVIGLPLNMDDGSEGPAAKRSREFGRRLGERIAAPVHYFDERLTSSDADWAMAGSGLTHGQKKARRDALAAAAILRDFLASIDPPEGGRWDDSAEKNGWD